MPKHLPRIARFLIFLTFLFGLLGVTTQHEKVQNELYRRYFGDFGIPAVNRDIYRDAANTYEVDWKLLAAIHRVETIFSTSTSMRSTVGAVGPFQFMPRTWIGWDYTSTDPLGDLSAKEVDYTNVDLIAEYGGLGRDGNGDGVADPYNLTDASHTAAYYLSLHGGRIDDTNASVRDALFEYNRSEQYVENVFRFYENYKQQAVLLPGSGMTFSQKTAWFGIRYGEWFGKWIF